MSKTEYTHTDMQGSEQELQRLIIWSKDNPKDWYRICHAESFESDAGYIRDLIERLYEANLLTVIYFVLYSNHFLKEIDAAIVKTIDECFIDMQKNVLLERLRKNLELNVKRRTENKQNQELVN